MEFFDKNSVEMSGSTRSLIIRRELEKSMLELGKVEKTDSKIKNIADHFVKGGGDKNYYAKAFKD